MSHLRQFVELEAWICSWQIFWEALMILTIGSWMADELQRSLLATLQWVVAHEQCFWCGWWIEPLIKNNCERQRMTVQPRYEPNPASNKWVRCAYIILIYTSCIFPIAMLAWFNLTVTLDLTQLINGGLLTTSSRVFKGPLTFKLASLVQNKRLLKWGSLHRIMLLANDAKSTSTLSELQLL